MLDITGPPTERPACRSVSAVRAHQTAGVLSTPGRPPIRPVVSR